MGRRKDTRDGVRNSRRGRRTLATLGLSGRLGARRAAQKARRTFAGAEKRREIDARYQMRSAQDVVETLGNMRGLMMKAAQMASFVYHGLPDEARDALAALQQDAPPMSGELAAETLERELGAAPDTLFQEWDPEPIAAASIGQVHRAITADDRAVAVKVQYPGIDAAIESDLENTGMLTRMMAGVWSGLDSAAMAEELRMRFREEIDYRIEADNQREFAGFYAGHPVIRVPAVVDSLSTKRVLTSELVDGMRFDEMCKQGADARSRAGEAIFRFVFRGIYDLKRFNGDPHPGNYLFGEDGTVAFLDFGLVRRFSPDESRMQREILQNIVLDYNPPAARRALEAAGILRPGAPFSDEDVTRHLRVFWGPVLDPTADFTYTHSWADDLLRHNLETSGREGELNKWLGVPAPYLILQRITFGLNAVLADLEATAPWGAILHELLPGVDAPAATELGRIEADWRAGAAA